MAGKRKIPQRMCVGCQQMKSKYELLRVVHTPEDEFLLDETGKKSGRGAYICKNGECFLKAFKEKRLEKSFKCKVEQSVYDSLRAKFENE
jgi:hypothetical protein